MNHPLLKTLINSADNSKVLSLSPSEKYKIEKERKHVLSIIEEKTYPIYGATTLVGHRDNKNIEVNLVAKQILTSHSFSHHKYFSLEQSKYIGLSKLFAWKAGGSGVSVGTFDLVNNTVNNKDFKPKIPKGPSYSSGDVSQAPMWTYDVLSFNKIEPEDVLTAEIMAFINGNFIQLGYAASLVVELSHVFDVFFCNTQAMAKLHQTDVNSLVLEPKEPITQSLIKLLRQSDLPKKPIQDCISIRSTSQQIDFFIVCYKAYLDICESMLSRPSGNPLFDPREAYPLSQASFLSFELTNAVAGIINAIDVLLSSVVGRSRSVCEGLSKIVPRDISNNDSDIGLIQHPKIMTATLESLRVNTGSSPLLSPASTSGCIEDMWDNSLNVLSVLEDRIEALKYNLMLEVDIISRSINVSNSFAASLKEIDRPGLYSLYENQIPKKDEPRSLYPYSNFNDFLLKSKKIQPQFKLSRLLGL